MAVLGLFTHFFNLEPMPARFLLYDIFSIFQMDLVLTFDVHYTQLGPVTRF